MMEPTFFKPFSLQNTALSYCECIMKNKNITRIKKTIVAHEYIYLNHKHIHIMILQKGESTVRSNRGSCDRGKCYIHVLLYTPSTTCLA